MNCDADSATEQFDAGSFRDRSGRVFYRDGGVYRALDESAALEWRHAEQAGFVRRFMQAGRIVRTQQADAPPPDDPQGRWHLVLQHERIPFISYPYEWCFSMLRDAARLHLDLMEAALEEGCILKDSTPFNVQFVDARPLFIDVASIVRLPPGEAWMGYRQFCQLMLYPLMLQAYRGVDFQPALRGRLDGIEPADMLRLLSLRDRFRRGVLTHVYLHARLQQRFGNPAQDARQTLKAHGFHRDLIRANVRRLRRIVDGLQWRDDRSAWSGYTADCRHVAIDAPVKAEFVRRVAGARQWDLVWDLGCNTGYYSRIAAEFADCVVALDADHASIDELYQTLQREPTSRIVPLVVDLADPSPGRGWRGRERRDLAARGRPQLTICLAVLHHLVIGRSLPLPEVVDWLADLGGELVVEFVGREDPQVQALLRHRADQFSDYTLPNFEKLLSSRFQLGRSAALPSGSRQLLHAIPRASPYAGRTAAGRQPIQVPC